MACHSGITGLASRSLNQHLSRLAWLVDLTRHRYRLSRHRYRLSRHLYRLPRLSKLISVPRPTGLVSHLTGLPRASVLVRLAGLPWHLTGLLYWLSRLVRLSRLPS